jgi:hypothetical protein
MVRERISPDEIVPLLLRVSRRWEAIGVSVHFVGIEDTQFQKLLILEARKTEGMPSVRPLKPGIVNEPKAKAAKSGGE